MELKSTRTKETLVRVGRIDSSAATGIKLTIASTAEADARTTKMVELSPVEVEALCAGMKLQCKMSTTSRR